MLPPGAPAVETATSGRVCVIDACCTLNLLATGREVELVEALHLRLTMSAQAHREGHHLSSPPDDEGLRRKELASTGALLRRGLLSIHTLDSEELLEAFVACAADLRDADASCVAMAGVLRVPLITDDRKERRIATSIFPDITLISTLELLRDAVAVLGWGEDELLQMARDLRWRGNFAPPRGDKLGAWYADILRRGGVPVP